MTSPAGRSARPPRRDPGDANGSPVAYRAAAGALMVMLGMVSGIVEAFLVPLRWGGVRVPVALLLAAAGNLALPWLAWWLSRSRLVTVLPSLGWFLVVLVFAGGTAEGDVVLAGGDWVAVVLLLLGSATAAAGAYSALLGVLPGRPRRQDGADS